MKICLSMHITQVWKILSFPKILPAIWQSLLSLQINKTRALRYCIIHWVIYEYVALYTWYMKCITFTPIHIITLLIQKCEIRGFIIVLALIYLALPPASHHILCPTFLPLYYNTSTCFWI